MSEKLHGLFRASIRPITPADFEFVRTLAAKFPTFTVPSDFLLWFFSQYHPDYCRILEHDDGSPKAYLLAMPTTEPQKGLSVWQVAASAPNQPFALEYFIAYLRDLIDRTEADSIFFSASQDVRTLRLIRSLAKRFFDCDVTQVHPVPAGQSEWEFRISPIRRQKQM